MDLGFETIGNATLVCHDRGPVLVTDLWIVGNAFFGSWGLSHEVPAEVLDNIKSSQYVWISHGHPDHLSPRSLDLLHGKQFLLAEHVGGRIRDGLKGRGFNVTVLRDREWYRISDRIRILSIADYNQDSVILIDIGDRLLVDLNDASDHGWGRFVKRIIRKYEISFHFQLLSGDNADMINIWREDGTFVGANSPANGHGREVARLTDEWGTKYFIPFSSLHGYRRTDSVWAEKYRIPLSNYPVGFESESSKMLPAFIRYDLEKDRFEEIDAPPAKVEPLHPKEFGDDWSEPLESSDVEKISAYFKAISHLEEFFEFIVFRVGKKEHAVEFAKSRFKRGLTFEAPRNSLMIAIENETFDDMLGGNFMKAILHGSFPKQAPLYPHFIPYVGKYADNGLAKSKRELDAYFKQYMMRAPLDYLKRRIESRVADSVRFSLEPDAHSFVAAKRTYHWLKRNGIL